MVGKRGNMKHVEQYNKNQENVKEEKTCCDVPMVPNGNETGIRCAKKCGYWEA